MNWSMVRCDAGNSGHLASQIRPPLRLKWKHKIAKATHALVVGSTLIVGCEDRIVAFNIHTLNEKWQKKGRRRDDFEFCDLAADEDRVYCKYEREPFQGELFALALATGKELWKENVNALGKKCLLVNGWLAAGYQVVDALTGKLVVEHPDKVRAPNLCVYEGGFVVRGGQHNLTHCYEYGTDEPKWIGDAGTILSGNELLGVGGFGTDQQHLTAHSLKDGRLLWKCNTKVIAVGVDLERIYGLVVTGKMPDQFGGPAYSIAVLDRKNRKEQWYIERPANSTYGRRPITSNDYLWNTRVSILDDAPLTCSDSRVFALEKTTGEVKWEHDLLKQIPSYHLITDKYLVVICRGTTFCFEVANGNTKKSAKNVSG